MPFLAPILAYLSQHAVEIGFSLAITLLQQTGVLKKWQADSLKAGAIVLQTVDKTKIYVANDQIDPKKSDFPEQIHHNGV